MDPTWRSELELALRDNPTREVMEVVAEALDRATAGRCDPAKHGAQCRLADAIRRHMKETGDCEM